MITNIHNESFGYATACFDVWAAEGNPEFVLYNSLTSSFTRTGSVEVYKYNINTDTHNKKDTLYRHLSDYEVVLLTTEGANTGSTGPYYFLHTELTGSIPFTSNLDFLVDIGNYFTRSGDGFGVALDMYGTFLAVGCPYFTSTANVGTASFTFTGSGTVDIFDLSRLDIDPYATRQPPIITGYATASGFITVQANVPANQQFSYIALEAQDKIPDNSPWVTVNVVQVTNLGGSVVISTNYISISTLNLRVRGIVGTDPYLITIPNPNNSITNSFGYSVSINSSWLAIGSSLQSGSKGAVFMYKQITGSSASWSFYQTLPVPSDINAGDFFGRDIALNKSTGSYSSSMVVGSAKASGSHAYIYEFNGTNWNLSFTLNSDYTTIYPLTFYPTNPIFSGSYPNFYDHYGWSVGMYKDTVIVGSPFDRHIYEYTGSSVYNQGSVYFYERCSNRGDGYYLARKSYGNEKILKNNRLGYSVDVWGDFAVAGSPKPNMNSMSICYLRGSLYQQHYCGDEENQIQGQYILYNHTTGSLPDTSHLDWGIKNIYQVKKRLLIPYRVFGFDTHICDNFITIGAPMLISDTNRIMDMTPSSGSFTGSLSDIKDITGKAYIYNLKNLRDQFYVGNVFYRNGKFVIMSSGSAFDGLLSSTVTGEDYEYDMFFKSKQVLFEKQIVCPVDIGEFNVSTNPTSIVLPTSSYDINHNGIFDFQDCDVLLRYMMYKNTEVAGSPITDWSSSILNNNTDEEVSVYNMFSSQWNNTDSMFFDNYSHINNTLFGELDLNEDNRIDMNDMNILWKYFIYRLTQKNYETYVTPNSKKKFLSDIIDFLNRRTLRGKSFQINPNFLDYARLSHADATGSYLAPYVTSIGLYNGTELVAIAKLGSPIKITPDFPINFCIKIDF